MNLNEQELRRVMAESMCDMRTVRKVYAGGDVRPSCVVRIVAAAAKLGVSLPPSVNASAAGVKP